MELWQIAALMGENEDVSDPRVQSKHILQERVRAAREGRELDPEELMQPMTDNDILAMFHQSPSSGAIANTV